MLASPSLPQVQIIQASVELIPETQLDTPNRVIDIIKSWIVRWGIVSASTRVEIRINVLRPIITERGIQNWQAFLYVTLAVEFLQIGTIGEQVQEVLNIKEENQAMVITWQWNLL
jgi:hypothetical protein